MATPPFKTELFKLNSRQTIVTISSYLPAKTHPRVTFAHASESALRVPEEILLYPFAKKISRAYSDLSFLADVFVMQKLMSLCTFCTLNSLAEKAGKLSSLVLLTVRVDE